jgi:thiamine-monophosphate kinase
VHETTWVERIGAQTTLRAGVELGIGDDAAVLSAPAPQVLTEDLLVEGVHFRRETTDAASLGHKALAASISDVAAMGAVPVAAVVGLVVPPDGGPDIGELYAGMEALAAEHAMTIAGGDLSKGPVTVLAVCVLGATPHGRAPLTRAGALPGDLVCVTGPLGGSEAGRLILERPELAPAPPVADALRAAHLRPAPRVADGLALAAAGAHALMDCSDGLALDLQRLAVASGCRAVLELEAVPRAPGADEVAAAAGRDPLEHAAGSGEDYELIAALPADRLDEAERLLERPLVVVGRFEEASPGLRLLRDGAPSEITTPGWVHDL